jgi:hypothetical protein
MPDYGKCAESIVLQLENPIIIIERSGPLQQRHWLEWEQHGYDQNSRQE